jgi:hypothetical protein
MFFDDLRDSVVSTVGLTDAQATTLLYNLVAQRLITIDRTSRPIVRLC